METPTVVALVIVLLVVAGGVYIATRPSTAAGTPMGELGGGAGGVTSEGAQYIQAGGSAIQGVLEGIGSLYGATQRQAGGSSAGAAK